MAELTLPLAKVRCMNCAGKIQSALLSQAGITRAEVNTEQAVLQGDFDPMAAVTAID
ncbi:heavy-metal-associated domain-containing protein, partial [Photobacterium sanctipauli]